MIERYHLVLAAIALAIGTVLAVVDRRGPKVFRDRVPGLVLSAAALLTVIVGVAHWFPWAVVAGVAVAPADDGAPPHPLGPWTWVLAIVSLAGIWASVPDTEPALAAGLCLVPVAIVRKGRGVSPGPVGTAVLVTLIAGAAWVGAAERVAPMCTASAVGAVLVAPLLLGYRRPLTGAGLALVAGVHCTTALAGSRAIMSMSGPDALGGAVLLLALDAAAVLVGAAISRTPAVDDPSGDDGGALA
ncbi:hypothetical protein [Dermatobacter hominis]|uniref:hypothetical protein n=1 Tax=Dermatobacter hominis TaxID=2884263 RepID=UPI001D12327D|nr:hypothetical protein [Dermatobacter hominis]UDY33936.1 hypothetical protein LH044_11320 [Dermatobacter hominis]